MINENDFYNLLKRMTNALEGINISLQKIGNSKTKETTQFVKESKQRMFEKRRRFLNENKAGKKFNEEIQVQLSPDNAVKKILEN
jgi:signal transduction protein with GAF and PtsI domain